MLLVAPVSAGAPEPRRKSRGPILPDIRESCLNQSATTKLLTSPKPRFALVTAAPGPGCPGWEGLDEKSKARPPRNAPATPELGAPWESAAAPAAVGICQVKGAAPLFVPLGLVVRRGG